MVGDVLFMDGKYLFVDSFGFKDITDVVKAEKPVSKKPVSKKPSRKEAKATKKATPKKSMAGNELYALTTIASKLKMDLIPVYEPDFALVDPGHVAMMTVKLDNGKSILGIDASQERMYFNIENLKMTKGKAEVTVDSDTVTIVNGGKKQLAEIKGPDSFPNFRVPKLDFDYAITVSPDTLKEQLATLKRMAKKSVPDVPVMLYGVNNDFRISSDESYFFGMNVSVGSYNKKKFDFASKFLFKYIEALATMFSLADSPCTLYMSTDFPLKGVCRIGHMEMEMLIAPQVE